MCQDLHPSRPKTRGDCKDGLRPCPWVGCRYHLALWISGPHDSLVIAHPDTPPWEMEHSCALDIAELGGLTLFDIGNLLSVGKERVRQMEQSALTKILHSATFDDWMPSAWELSWLKRRRNDERGTFMLDVKGRDKNGATCKSFSRTKRGVQAFEALLASWDSTLDNERMQHE